mgnify:CR=1 FL=1
MNEASIILWHSPTDVKWVSVNANGARANSFSTRNLSISADGRSIFFGSDVSNLVDGDSNNRRDLFVANNLLYEASGVGGTGGADETSAGTRPEPLFNLVSDDGYVGDQAPSIYNQAQPDTSDSSKPHGTRIN